VISNGVINLVPDKVGAYREIARVLKPGGRVQIADICVERDRFLNLRSVTSICGPGESPVPCRAQGG
jgi:ubiquinone/menaquinone biosynthesis C-methylase UbiE